jgi:hypothetical protein
MLEQSHDRDPLQWVASKPATRRSGFLDFPRELRDMIYTYALTSTFVIAMETFEARSQIVRVAYLKAPDSLVTRCQWKPRLEPGTKPSEIIRGTLLQTCRQIHAEAAPILYSQNDFRLADWADAALVIAPTYQHLVRKISLEFVRSHYQINNPYDHDVAGTWLTIAHPIHQCYLLFRNITNLSLVFDMHFNPYRKRWFDSTHSVPKVVTTRHMTAQARADYFHKCLEPACRLRMNDVDYRDFPCLSIKFIPMFNAYGWSKDTLAHMHAEEEAINSAFKKIQATKPELRRPSVRILRCLADRS